MGYSKYKFNRLFKKVSIVSTLILILFIIFTLTFHGSSKSFDLIVLKNPFQNSISKYTSLFNTILEPKCENFTTYNLDSSNYWQYYGFSHHMQLNEDTLSNILQINQRQEEEISRIHHELINYYLTPKYPAFTSLEKSVNGKNLENNKGIVYVSGEDYYWLTILSIKFIRDHMKDKTTPIEIFVPFRDANDHYCNKISMTYDNVKCLYFSDYLSWQQMKKISGYQYKSLALLLTSFNDILYLDSDNIPINNIQEMFEDENYRKTGFVSWPDFWKRSTNYKFYKMSGLSNYANPISTIPSIESGQILINKNSHLKTLLLSYYYNFYGPEYFYPIFSQGFPGEGDKETFYLASRVVNEKSFVITGQTTKSFGYKDKNSKYIGQGILQMNPSNSNKYWFLHVNYPKLNINNLFLNNNYQKNNNIRKWMIIRNAQDDGKGTGFWKKLGIDLEFEIWNLMIEILTVDFKGFKIFKEIGNDEICDYVKEHVKKLQNSKLNLI